MAENIRKLKSGKYQVRFVHPVTRKRVAKTFARQNEARDWYKAQCTDIARGDWIDPTAANVPLRKWCATWRASLTVRDRTVDAYEASLRLHVLDDLGDIPLSSLTPAIIREWYSKKSATVGRSALRNAYRVLSQAMNAAVRDGVIKSNPCVIRGAGTARTQHEIRPLTVEEVWRVHDAIDSRFRAWFLVSAYGGLRWGEAIALRVGDVDLAAGVVQVSRQLQEARTGGGMVVAPPKSDAGRRAVGLPSYVVDAIRTQIEHETDGEPESLITTASDGRPLRGSNFRRRVWIPATAVLTWSPVIHDLRHTAASIAISAGADIKQLQQMMGHAQASTTLDTYGHLMTSAPQAVAAKLAGFGRPAA